MASLIKQISEINGVNTITPKTPQDAYNEAKEIFGIENDIMDSIEPSIFPSSL